MIDWVLAHHRGLVRASRWIVLALGAALLGIAQLPHSDAGRVIALLGLSLVAIAFLSWLSLTVLAVVRPHMLETLRRKRAAERDR